MTFFVNQFTQIAPMLWTIIRGPAPTTKTKAIPSQEVIPPQPSEKPGAGGLQKSEDSIPMLVTKNIFNAPPPKSSSDPLTHKEIPQSPTSSSISKKSEQPLSQKELVKLHEFQKPLMDLIYGGEITPEHLQQFEERITGREELLNYPTTKVAPDGTVRYQTGETIVHLIGKTGSAKFIPILQKHGINLSIQGQDGVYGNTALHWAIANAQNETALALIQHSSQDALSVKDKSNNNTPLHMTIAKGYTFFDADFNRLNIPNIELTKELIKRGADVNAINKFGLTPLHIACLRRDIDSIRLLLDHGARTDILSPDRKSPLEFITFNHSEAEKRILDNVISPILLDEDAHAKNYNDALLLLTKKSAYSLHYFV